MRSLASFLLCSLAASGAPAQDAPEVTSRQAPATFDSRVNLVSVPVVVRDSKGRVLANLRQEDFGLFDKGKEQVVTKFSVIVSSGQKAVATSAGPPSDGPGANTDSAP